MGRHKPYRSPSLRQPRLYPLPHLRVHRPTLETHFQDRYNLTDGMSRLIKDSVAHLFYAVIVLALPSWTIEGTGCTKEPLRLLKPSMRKSPNPFEYPPPADLYTKRRRLAEAGFSYETRSVVVKLGYLGKGRRAAQRRLIAIRDLGLTQDQLDFIEKNRIFEIEPLEYRRLTTLPPANPSYVFTGATISRPNPDGHLENAVVLKVVGDEVFIQVTNGATTLKETIPKSSAYRPIAPGQEVIITNSKGIPELKQLIEITPDNYASFHSQRIWGGITIHKLPISELALLPRRAISTTDEDLSSSLNPLRAQQLRLNYTQFNDLALSLSPLDKASEEARRSLKELINRHNVLVQRLQEELRKQGIAASLLTTGGRNNFLHLEIEGVHKNGNRVARLYMKALERQGIQRLAVSLTNNLHYSTQAYQKDDYAVVLGFEPVMSLLQKEKTIPALLHQAHYLMFSSHRYLGIRSIFDMFFDSDNAAKNLFGRPNSGGDFIEKASSSFSLEELYTNLLDASRYAHRIERNPQAAENLAESLRILGLLSSTASNILDDILNNTRHSNQLPEQSVFNPENNSFEIPDPLGRKVHIAMPRDTTHISDDEIFADLARTKEMINDIQQRVQDITILTDTYRNEPTAATARKIVQDMRRFVRTIYNEALP